MGHVVYVCRETLGGIHGVKVGCVGDGVGSRISRADMVAFILQQVEDDTCVCQAPVLSN